MARGRGWREEWWPGGDAPTRTALDTACGDARVALRAHDGHSLWLSSAALSAAAGDLEVDGGVVERDGDGEPTGILPEEAAWRFEARHRASRRHDGRRELGARPLRTLRQRMPEGDTIHHAANRIRPILAGLVPQIATPHPRFAGDRWPEKLAGRAVEGVDAHGKHLFLRFEGARVVHSHLRMTGAWGTYREGQRWRRSPRRAWLVLRAAGHEVVEFDGPVLELLTASRARLDQRLADLGPDILAPELDEARFLRRLREDDPTRPIGDALLDQRTIAGIGNLWKCEGCFAAGIDPWRAVGAVSDAEALAIVRVTRPRMQQSARDGNQTRFRTIYGRSGRPCPRCGAVVRQRGQGDDNRLTYWCPGCQP